MVSFLPPSVLQGAPSDLHLENVLVTLATPEGATTEPASLKEAHSTLMSPLPGTTLCRTALPPLPLKPLPLPMPATRLYLPVPPAETLQFLSLNSPAFLADLTQAFQTGLLAEAPAAVIAASAKTATRARPRILMRFM